MGGIRVKVRVSYKRQNTCHNYITFIFKNIQTIQLLYNVKDIDTMM
jgi:hypothetical protein